MIRNFRFDFFLWNEIKEKEISFGELVSELIKLKTVKNINALLSILLNLNFLAVLKSFTYSVKSTAFFEIEDYWLNNYHQILKDIDSIYELRNILAPHRESEQHVLRRSSLSFPKAHKPCAK